MDANGTVRMRSTIKATLKRANGFVDTDVVNEIIKEGGAELFYNKGVQMARAKTTPKVTKVRNNKGRAKK